MQSIHPSDDLARLKSEYSSRDQKLSHQEIYSPLNIAYLFTIQQRQRAVVDLLKANRISNLNNLRILEVGSGRGDVLYDYMGFRLYPKQLHGTDFLFLRLLDTQARFPAIPISCADAQHLPYANGSFDLVLQYTVFSSILDYKIRENIALEMLRVLRPVTGLILWYDFWINPLNKQTKGIRKPEIEQLFTGNQFTFKKITLAPPIARRIVPKSWLLGVFFREVAFI